MNQRNEKRNLVLGKTPHEFRPVHQKEQKKNQIKQTKEKTNARVYN